MNTTSKFAGLIAFAALGVASASAEVVYNSITSPLPPGVVSEGYQCCSTAELGNIVTPAANGATFASASVVMNNWAYASEWAAGWDNGAFTVDPAGYTVPITLTLYGVGAGDSVGPVLASVTESVLIPWRPEPDATNCPAGPTNFNNDYSSGGNCYTGSTSLATFDLSALNLTVPEQFIYGVSYNTFTHGYAPLGYDGPFDSLNVGLEQSGPSVGADNGLGVYYVAGEVNGNVFSHNDGSTNSSVADITGYGIQAEFTDSTTPEPSTFGLIGIGLCAMVFAARRKRLA